MVTAMGTKVAQKYATLFKIWYNNRNQSCPKLCHSIQNMVQQWEPELTQSMPSWPKYGTAMGLQIMPHYSNYGTAIGTKVALNYATDTIQNMVHHMKYKAYECTTQCSQ